MSRETHHIVPDPRGGWNVKRGRGLRSSRHLDHKVDAIDIGRAISRNQHTEFVIHNRNGRIARSDSHNNVRTH